MRNALDLPAPERYEYFIKRAADWGVLYGLRSASGWALAGDEAEPRAFPVWPHERFAELCAKEEWSDCIPVEIPLPEWFEDISPSLLANSVKVAVFKVPGGRGVVVELERLSSDLKKELSLMEDEGE